MNKKPIIKMGVLGLVLCLAVVTPGCGVCGFGPGQILIRDPQLELALRQALNVPFSCITRADMLRLTDLNASNFGIRYLDGIEAATNLVNLDLSDNFIENIIAIRDLDNLATLDLNNNGIDIIEPISGLNSLRDLDFGCNGTIRDWNPLVAVVTTNSGFLEGGTIRVDEDSIWVGTLGEDGQPDGGREVSLEFSLASGEIASYAAGNGVLIEVTFTEETEACGF